MPSKPHGFVALASLKKPAPTPDEALAEIRRIYFRTTARTIEHDLAHAIALLKSLAEEAVRDKAAVYMDGLAELRSEWQRSRPAGASPKRPSAPRAPASSRARRKKPST